MPGKGKNRNRRIGRPRSVRYYWTAQQKAEFRALYECEELSIGDIAVRFGVSNRTIQYHLQRAGVKFRPVGCQTEQAKDKQRGANHHSWRGGRYFHSRRGYYYLLKPEHPHANREGYIAEHRYVCEQHLLAEEPTHPALKNGLLRRSWVVHHKNHNKIDNRPENLEPMQKKHHTPLMHMKAEIAALREILASNGIEVNGIEQSNGSPPSVGAVAALLHPKRGARPAA